VRSRTPPPTTTTTTTTTTTRDTPARDASSSSTRVPDVRRVTPCVATFLARLVVVVDVSSEHQKHPRACVREIDAFLKNTRKWKRSSRPTDRGTDGRTDRGTDGPRDRGSQPITRYPTSATPVTDAVRRRTTNDGRRTTDDGRRRRTRARLIAENGDDGDDDDDDDDAHR
jgi:hypothetical protein